MEGLTPDSQRIAQLLGGPPAPGHEYLVEVLRSSLRQERLLERLLDAREAAPAEAQPPAKTKRAPSKRTRKAT